MNAKNKKPFKYLVPVFVLFIIINSACLTLRQWLAAKNINADIVLIGNLIIFLLTLLTFFMQASAAKKSNPNVFVRSVMGSSFIKIVVIAGAAITYLISAGENRSVYAVVLCMLLYLAYTFIEVKSAYKFQKENGGN
ncbi:MAG TPA: hypothetical protein PL045_10075 [Chitinophagaceae bacterium]|nr:hypothetical protein [Chitinophagaceae bacterium]